MANDGRVPTCVTCGHADPHDVPPIQLCRACPCDGPVAGRVPTGGSPWTCVCDYGVIGPICTHCGGTFPGAIAGRVPSPLTGLANDPERRYTYGGRVAHLLAYGIDYNAAPYTQAYCGYSPTWGAAWLGSGSQAEEDEANRLRLCKRCTAAADEVRGFVEGLQRDLGMTAPAKPQT